jgi:hypothetical protein
MPADVARAASPYGEMTDKHHHVYVIELDKRILDEPKFIRANPAYARGKDCYYVGMTGLTPQQRFENHRAGHKSNRFVQEYGIALRPLLYEEYNPLSYEDAVEMEAALARMLRGRGHAVWQK